MNETAAATAAAMVMENLTRTATPAAPNALRELMYSFFIPVIVLLCLLAALFNIVVFVSRCYVRTKTSSLELTYSLALSDTWTSTVIALSLFWNSYKPVILQIPHADFCFSLTLEAFRTGGLLTGIFHLVALGFVHYLQIVRPFDHMKVHILIVLIWTVPPIFFVLYFAAWTEQGYRSPKCAVNAFYDTLVFRSQISLIIITLMCATCFAYWKMLAKISSVRTRTAGSTGAPNGSGQSRGRRTVVTAAIIFGTFVIGWLPASISFFLSANGMPLHSNGSNAALVFFGVTLIAIMIKSLLNPIIYATRIPEIRQFILDRVLLRWQDPKKRREEMTPLRANTSTYEPRSSKHAL